MSPRAPDATYDAICDRGELTRRQLAIWAGDRLAAGSPVFVEAGVIHMYGAFDPACFRRALQAVVDESDALRIVFEDDEGWPRQRVRAAQPATVELVELQGGAAAGEALEALARERVATRVGVETGMWDATLVRVARDHHVWVFAQHQLVSDAWSFGLLHARMVAHYDRLRLGGDLAPDPTPTFTEYVAHERRFRGSQRSVAARAFWEARYVDGGESAARWAGSREAATRTCRVVRPLGPAVTAGVRRLAATVAVSADVGLFAIMASVVAVWVARSTGVRDVVFSAAFANRPSARFKRTAGCFMNVCPVGVDVRRGDTFRDLIARATAEVWEAGSHQQFVGRPGAVPQPYEIFLNVHKESVAAHRFTELPIEVFSLAPTHRFGALGVAIEDFGATSDLTLVLDCNEATFGLAARDQLAGGLLALLAACVEDPDRCVDAGSPGPDRVANAAPGTESERTLAAGVLGVWRDLLGIDDAALDDDFFALGGDSLMAYRMLARLRVELGIAAAVEVFLERPTIAGLVAAAVRADAGRRSADA